MPISAEQASLWSPPGHADTLIPIPQGRLTVTQAHKMLNFTMAVIHCFLPTEGTPAIFAELTPREEELCRLVQVKVASRRATLGDKPGAAGASRWEESDERFRLSFGHEDGVSARNTNVPFLRLMYLPAAAQRMHAYIQEALQWMVLGGSIQRNFIPVIWMGLRDWATSSAWTRGQTLLAARAYREHVAVAYLTRQLAQETGLAHGGGAVHSLAHIASLTLRQARRSGVSQDELRGRWA